MTRGLDPGEPPEATGADQPGAAGADGVERGAPRPDDKRAVLRAALEEGERSGIAEDSSLPGLLAEFRARRSR